MQVLQQYISYKVQTCKFTSNPQNLLYLPVLESHDSSQVSHKTVKSLLMKK